MADNDQATVSCPCGASITVDLKGGRPVTTCPDCRQSLTIVVAVDPRTKQRRVGILVSPAALAPKKGKPKAPPPPPTPAEVKNPKCACGARVVVDLRSMDSIYACGWCGASYTAVTSKAGGIPLLMPVEVLPLKKEKPKTRIIKPETKKISLVKPDTKKIPKTAPAGGAATKEALLLTAKDLGAQPLVAREHGSVLYCFCGHEVAVSADAAHRLMKCPECGLSFRIFLAVDPQSRQPMVVTLPRGPLPGKK